MKKQALLVREATRCLVSRLMREAGDQATLAPKSLRWTWNGIGEAYVGTSADLEPRHVERSKSTRDPGKETTKQMARTYIDVAVQLSCRTGTWPPKEVVF